MITDRHKGNSRNRMTSLVLSLLLIGLAITGVAILTGNAAGGHSPTPQNFKVAFIGDQGIGSSEVAVLNLIKAEGAGMVLHQGDLTYTDDPAGWEAQINSVLGSEFPYFASVGNHDSAQWTDFQSLLLARLNNVDGATCVGDLGVNSACAYKGLFFILSGVGTLGTGHEQYIADQLAADNSIWKICSWHKNQWPMHTGASLAEIGWGTYEACRQGGAIIATAHEHSYSRTHLIDDFETQSIVSTSTILKLESGKTFVFVSGLGGKDIRGQSNEMADKPWWASVYNSTNGANFGALFCTFNKNGVESQAHCYFKDIDGNIPDEFDLEVEVHTPSATTPTPVPPTPTPTPVPVNNVVVAPSMSEWGLAALVAGMFGVMVGALQLNSGRRRASRL